MFKSNMKRTSSLLLIGTLGLLALGNASAATGILETDDMVGVSFLVGNCNDACIYRFLHP